MFLLVLIIAVVNLALGIALAVYFDPARGTERELHVPVAAAPVVEKESPAAQPPAKEPEPEPEAAAEPVAEDVVEEEPAAEEPETPVDEPVEQPVVSDIPSETLSQRELSACEAPLNEFQEHIDAQLGLLRDMEQRLRKQSESLEIEDVSKLASDLVSYHAEFDAHVNELMNQLDEHRDTWVEAAHTVEHFLEALRETKRSAEAIDTSLRELSDEEDAALAGDALRRLLHRAINLVFEHRDRVEAVRSEMMFDLGLLPQLTGEDFASGLPDILNRLGIETTIRRWRQKQTSSTRPYSLAVVGVDRLADLNDSFGTETVDKILGHIAAQTLEAIRSDDAMGYFDGSKFLLFFPETGPASATSYLERMRQNLVVTMFENGDADISVTTSCGVVEGDPDDAIDALAISAVDTMKAARAEGGNCTMVLEHGEPTAVSPPDYAVESKTISL